MLLNVYFFRFSNVQAATWEEINSKLGLVCPNIFQLADLVLTIPASSADAERGHSRLKKTLRQTREQEFLIAICQFR